MATSYCSDVVHQMRSPQYGVVSCRHGVLSLRAVTEGVPGEGQREASWDRLRPVLATLCPITLRPRSDRPSWSRAASPTMGYPCAGEILCRGEALFDSSWCLSGMPRAASLPAILVETPLESPYLMDLHRVLSKRSTHQTKEQT